MKKTLPNSETFGMELDFEKYQNRGQTSLTALDLDMKETSSAFLWM